LEIRIELKKEGMVDLYTDTYNKKYKATAWSFAFLFCLAMLIITITLPLYLAYASNNFWVSITTDFEKPSIKFKNLCFIQVVENNQVKSFSTISRFNSLANSDLIPAQVGGVNLDSDNDDFTDIVEVKIKLMASAENISGVNIILGFNYELEQVVNFEMDGVLFFNLFPQGATKIAIEGDIGLKQENPFVKSGVNSQETDTFFQDLETQSYSDGFTTYNSRNETLVLENKVINYMNLGYSKEVLIEMKLKVPEKQEIIYKPALLESLKFAWVNYFSLLFPIALIIMWIVSFTFKYQIFPSGIVHDYPRPEKIKTF
jgi:hypothetical protein